MYIKVKAKAESSRNGIVVKSADSLEVSVRAKAQRGEANDAIRFLLAEHFNIHPAKVRLIKGRTSKSKIFEIQVDSEPSKA